jgi:hypothetical protein
MAYEIRLPHDTLGEIQEFILTEYADIPEQIEALNLIERELAYLGANPMLGISVPGGPFESRKIHRFLVPLTVTGRTTAEFAYTFHRQDGIVVVSGFRPLP